MRKKKIDHTQFDKPEYWNKLLADFGLAVDRGRHPKTVYVGDSKHLSLISDLESSRVGRVPKRPECE